MKFRDENTKRVKENILKTAGRLFANNSYSDVGLRTVAKEASSTLNTVTYHFGSKQRLFEETLAYVFSGDDMVNMLAAEIVEIEFLSPYELSQLLYRLSHELVFSTVGKTVNRWRTNLINRLLIDENAVANSLIITNFQKIGMEFLRIIRASGVDIKDREYKLWAVGIWAELQFLSIGKMFILESYKSDDYTDEILDDIVMHLVNRSCKFFDLPILDMALA